MNTKSFLIVFLIAGPLFASVAAGADGPKDNRKWLYVSKLALDGKQGNGVRWFRKKDDDEFGSITATDLASFAKSAQEYDLNREFWTASDPKEKDIVVVYVDLPTNGKCEDKKITIEFSEKVRNTQLEDALAKILSSEKIAALDGSAPAICSYPYSYTLKEVRAILSINVSTPKDDPTDSSQSSTGAIITGPEENWFITTDVLNNGLSQLKYDSTNKTLTEKTAPNNPFIGLNYLIGDPYKDYAGYATWQRLGFKLLVKPDKPKDNFGLGFGYLFQSNVFDSDQSGSFMVFVARMWSRTDNNPFKRSWRFGLSYNFGSFNSGKK